MSPYDEFDDYFLWLCALVNADMERYSELLWHLMDADFYYILELDESRSVEGLALRETFYNRDKTCDWVMFWDKPCSVLEALIALAQRMNDALMDEIEADRTRVWFWMMVKNLGLKQFDNEKFAENPMNCLCKIDGIVANWLNRTFELDGFGSVFPLDEPTRDQRRLSLVYQMYDYIFEKIPNPENEGL